MSLNIKATKALALVAKLALRLGTLAVEAVTIALPGKRSATEDDVAPEQRFTRLMSMANAIADELSGNRGRSRSSLYSTHRRP